MSHALKLFLKIVHNRIWRKCEANLSTDQFAGLGTGETLFTLQLLPQKCHYHGKDIYLCFTYLEKGFDKVNHIELLQILKGIALDNNDTGTFI